MKTFNDCLEAVKPEWLEGFDNVSHMPDCWDGYIQVPTERQAHQIINLKKMMVIAEAVGMPDMWVYELVCSAKDFPHQDLLSQEARDFIRICQDPDGDGDPQKDLFNPFKPEAK